MKFSLVLILICLAAGPVAIAQSNDNAADTARNIESERQRLGNQRIQREAERKALEEQQRREEEEQAARVEQDRLKEAELRAREERRVEAEQMARVEQQRLEEAERERIKAQEVSRESKMAGASESESTPSQAIGGANVSPSQSIESQRQRLGSQRIQQEAEMKRREEERRLQEAEQQRLRAQQESADHSNTGATGLKSNSGLSWQLDQLKTLGELKERGYITEKEFKKIKKRILDDRN